MRQAFASLDSVRIPAILAPGLRDRAGTPVQFVAEGYQPANGEASPTGRLRIVSLTTSRFSACRYSPVGISPMMTVPAHNPRGPR